MVNSSDGSESTSIKGTSTANVRQPSQSGMVTLGASVIRLTVANLLASSNNELNAVDSNRAFFDMSALLSEHAVIDPRLQDIRCNAASETISSRGRLCDGCKPEAKLRFFSFPKIRPLKYTVHLM
ncbi:unnamed protein product [Soboliphyme baturini]|uniref:Uncharacterized protein n=1 Tax=Soboliphyme baturini TaxID=241478 RepID=A0A183IF52_9BILA|nr:unnamed protein product [Soboliphyme baturini]